MEIIKKPILTEKASLLTEKLNRYAFKVDHRANKIQIKTAVEQMFGVTVVAVNTAVVAGKAKSRYTKAGFVSGRSPKYKKAIITVKDGETIDFYSTL
ncbi:MULTISPECIES: 50S ribosomal protein L23 [Sphingobacterium]|uniref:Large ribosomal subunit protein uL23 n=1 Tax=Sphingobacterium cellulitidis TaxID=1768011 RepID=A0A8H9G2A5_9SPHI|nr:MULTISPECIES: 50S ribosomal protein L23 [Sphingobacterium]MBA8987994.1 large subunit ribosomal protein L23 [Sphingobacterium soli]OYD41379.1 50S ribosomal protein L23 [Sphingobacterium cellulitidis]OYD45859.1 50S ribosomal protein L23 [Sphingobacterium cellulitidis]WFB62945.1 50S ribosomal protein L23 [Sphingobacterium sp. WM]GGE26443.1 50S ribosomal protein L23 [Sphingobacterium soli]